MKLKTTKKKLMQNYGGRAIALGYCEAQRLFNGSEAKFYTAGVYGWNFDAFVVDGVLVTTGYRGMFGLRPDSEFVEKYDKLAEKLRHEYIGNYINLQYELYTLQKKFVNEVLNKKGA